MKSLVSYKPLASVLVTVYNEEENIHKCVKSVLDQSFKNFELVILDDCSTDNTRKVLSMFKDKRLKIFFNQKNLGIAKSRNLLLSKASGKYIFFTDSDCFVNKDWLEQGLKCFINGYAGVEGKTFYVVKKRDRTISDRVVENVSGDQWMTSNIAYDISILKKVGGFAESCKGMYEDRELAIRILEIGKIKFCKNMIAYHKKKVWTIDSLFKWANDCAKSGVYLMKKHGKHSWKLKFGFVLFPEHLVCILFPPAFLFKLFKDKVRSFYDFKIFLFYFLVLYCERYWIWKGALKERVFLV